MAVYGGDLPTARIADDQPVAQAEDLAVDVQHRPAGVVGDVGVLAEVEEPPANQVHGSIVTGRGPACRSSGGRAGPRGPGGPPTAAIRRRPPPATGRPAPGRTAASEPVPPDPGRGTRAAATCRRPWWSAPAGSPARRARVAGGWPCHRTRAARTGRARKGSGR